MEKSIEKSTFLKRLKNDLKADFKRLSVSPLFYILVGIALVVPVLILVMTTMTEGSVDVEGAEITAGFTSVWQIIGTVSDSSGAAGGGMDMLSMCNINLIYFAAAVLVALFVSEEFKCGYCKNFFTLRAKKGDYVISKNIVCLVGATCMILAFFVGALIGGAVSGLSFALDGFTALNVVFCILSKIALLPVFISIFFLASVIGKQKTWLSVCISLGAGMLLFMMIPALTPINATIVNVCICLVGSAAFSLGLGFISKMILDKTSLA